MFFPQRRLLAAHFQALSNVTRLGIVERLAEVGEESVNDLAGHLHMSQPRVSWHLAMLRRGEAVRQRKEGRQVYCSLDLESIRRQHRAFWEMLDQHRRIGVKT